jgi:hypothetical protein
MRYVILRRHDEGSESVGCGVQDPSQAQDDTQPAIGGLRICSHLLRMTCDREEPKCHVLVTLTGSL